MKKRKTTVFILVAIFLCIISLRLRFLPRLQKNFQYFIKNKRCEKGKDIYHQ
jgi:hypothetical protein